MKNKSSINNKNESEHNEECTETQESARTIEVNKESDDTKRVDDTEFSMDEILKMQEIIELCKEENSELKDQLVRNRAELENSKKRLSRHYDDLSKEKIRRLLLDVITLLDDFERAYEANSSVESNDFSSVIEGIKMIEMQFIQTLETKWNVVRFNTEGSDFDPARHEAMMSVETEGIDSPQVIDILSKGYMFEDKVLRPAKVKVGVPKGN